MKRVFPVIHLTNAYRCALAAATAREAGAAGVFLINMGNSVIATSEAVDVVRQTQPGLWLGANILGMKFSEAVTVGGQLGLDGIWSDESPDTTVRGWEVETFGAAAFKTQRAVPTDQLADTAERVAHLCDVVTGSGRGTGLAADANYLKEMRAGVDRVPGSRLAVASGVSPLNAVVNFMYADDVLLATGIEEEFGVLDEKKLKRVCEIAVQLS